MPNYDSVVIGAGILGLTTALLLSQANMKVCIIDCNTSEALETSFKNGGQLSFSHILPFSHSLSLSQILLSQIRQNSPYNIPLNNVNLWGKYNLFSKSKNNHNLIKYLADLSVKSNVIFSKICNDLDVRQEDISFNNHGILHFYDDKQLLNKNTKINAILNEYKLNNTLLNSRQILEKEENLFNIKALCGGFYFPDDKIADCYLVASKIRAYLEKKVDFIFSGNVQSAVLHNNRITGIKLQDGRAINGNNFILSSGAWTNNILSKFNLQSVNTINLRGYSFTIDVNYSNFHPQMGLIDNKNRMVYSYHKTSNTLRVAGFGDVCQIDKNNINTKPHSHSFIQKRQQLMLRKIYHYFPTLKRSEIIHKWTGVRTLSMNCEPYIGNYHNNAKNLFINCGHGTQGFTLSFASAQKLCNLINI